MSVGPAMERVAVLVVSYNTAEVLAQNLAQLTAVAGLEVVVVDNGSDDGSAAMVGRDFPTVNLVALDTNLGFGAASNIAAATTRRAYLLVLNPDCTIPAEGIAALVAALDADPELGFAGPRILKASGSLDAACLRGDPDPVGALLYVTRVTRLFPGNPAINRYNLTHLDYNRDQELLNGTAACLMFRAAAFREVGGFDEAFFMYGEDLDLCRRLRAAGHPGRYVASAEALHLKGEASRRDSERMLREFHRAMWIYYRKHEAGRRPPPLNALVAAGISGLGLTRLAVNALRRDKRVSAR